MSLERIARAPLVFAITVTALAMSPAGARAQAATDLRIGDATSPRAAEGARTAHADALVAKARAIDLGSAAPHTYLQAGRLYRSAAALRGDAIGAVADWRMAAWAYSAARDNQSAYRMMKRSAETSSRAGDVERAIDAYLDAALLAASIGRRNQAAHLVARAEELLASPSLAPERRLDVERRVAADPVARALRARR